jgi:Ca2+-binding RTX toxin-like protein
MNADGGGQRRLYQGQAHSRGPAWSPDGRRLVFESLITSDWQVYAMNADGTRVTRMTGLPLVRTSTGRRCSVIGSPGADVLRGTSGVDVICGLGGNDIILAGAGDDVVDAGPGADRVDGGAGADELLGGGGDDVLVADDGTRDWVDGGAGRDAARADAGDWLRFVETRS